ncbi:MAG: hypothetical protein M1822_002110 [Bathelium mastoideum]|nr:MAG: hypothetical protein M1822_002110 [Bathelium mastoideum]
MVLEPLSAFSLACNILQVVEYGSKVLKKAADYQKATDGLLSEHQDLRNVLQSLQSFNADLQASMTKSGGWGSLNAAEARLVDANAECLRLSSDFIHLLDRLRLKNKKAMLESLRLSIKTLWYREKTEAMEKNVSRARDNLNIAFLIYINSTQATAAGQNEVLKCTTRVEENVLGALNASSTSLKSEIRELVDQLEHINLDTVQQQTISEFRLSNRDVLQHLTKQINVILTNSNEQKALAEGNQTSMAEEKILSSLQFSQLDDRQGTIHKAQEETYQWILQSASNDDPHDNNLITWLSSPTDLRRLYWICGKVGSGKSTLMKFLKENIKVRDHMVPWAENYMVVQASFFFWNPGNKLQKSLTGLMRSLLVQLLEQTPSLIPRVVPFRKWRAARTFSNHVTDWSDSELQQSLNDYLLNVRQFAKIFLLIDGLDELEGTDEMRDDLIEFLMTLVKFENIKICLSSRPWNVFQDAFRVLPQIRLEDLTRGDISRYVKSQLRANTRFQYLLNRDAVKTEDFITFITDKAQGVFLWVWLVLRELLIGLQDGDGIRVLWRTLEDIPADLTDYFRRMMNSIKSKYRQEASIFLQIALHKEHEFTSLHPLRLLDLSFVEEGRPDFALAEWYNFRKLNLIDSHELELLLESTNRRLNSRCMGLLECQYTPDRDTIFDHPPGLDQDEIGMGGNDKTFEPSIYHHIFNDPLRFRSFSLSIDFLHRSYRDFLLTSDGQNLLHQYSKTPYDARLFLFNARLAQLIAVHATQSDPDLAFGIASYLMSILSLPTWRGTAQSVVAALKLQPVCEGLVKVYQAQGTSWYLDSSCKTWPKEASSFTTVAIDFGLSGYLRSFLTQEYVRCKQGRPILDYILRPRFAQTTSFLKIGNQWPDLETLRRILEFGADPNEMYNGISVWALYLNFVNDLIGLEIAESYDPMNKSTRLGIAEAHDKKDAYFGALAVLIQTGAALLLPVSWFPDGMEYYENLFYSSSLEYYFGDLESDRWPMSTPVIRPGDNGVSEPSYAVVDLIENFRSYFGSGIDELKWLIWNRQGTPAVR